MVKLKLETFEEQIFFSTILWKNLTDGKFGTGFLIAKPIGEEDKVKILLFSNKHVFWWEENQNTPHIKKKCTITLHKEKPDGSYELGDVQIFEDLTLDRDSPGYHESLTEDVAAIDITHFYNLSDFRSWMRSLELSDFGKYEYSEITPWETVTYVGYPRLIYDEKNYLPIMRKGTISSIPSVDFNWEKKILIEAQVFSGSSGSPVFTTFNWKYYLLGILWSSLFTEKEKTKPTEVLTIVSSTPKASEWMECFWIAKVTKKDAIYEVYDMF